jgi:hypothetical protein
MLEILTRGAPWEAAWRKLPLGPKSSSWGNSSRVIAAAAQQTFPQDVWHCLAANLKLISCETKRVFSDAVAGLVLHFRWHGFKHDGHVSMPWGTAKWDPKGRGDCATNSLGGISGLPQQLRWFVDVVGSSLVVRMMRWAIKLILIKPGSRQSGRLIMCTRITAWNCCPPAAKVLKWLRSLSQIGTEAWQRLIDLMAGANSSQQSQQMESKSSDSNCYFFIEVRFRAKLTLNSPLFHGGPSEEIWGYSHIMLYQDVALEEGYSGYSWVGA